MGGRSNRKGDIRILRGKRQELEEKEERERAAETESENGRERERHNIIVEKETASNHSMGGRGKGILGFWGQKGPRTVDRCSLGNPVRAKTS
ncbi:hypothetical protein TIFTF001_041593 [Ficus carica]|uniref:Uncharacterized protein n=1 Tax=Ficus carica TaxID=3494 RepID=A0AA88D9X9_FICCA|nr:hypothetical protein TIFTF001_041593 [Ficus carica]